MTARDVLRRLEAWDAGGPLQHGTTRHLKIARDPELLTVAFVRMGGESLPWAVGVAHPGEEPTVFAVPEARNRDAVAAMLAEFAPHMLRHLGHPELGEAVENGDACDLPLRQLWFPNPSHLAMLHMISARYTFARRGEPMRIALLNALGRAAAWAFTEAQRTGQAGIVDAAAALRGAFEFPADDLRQQHLGFLLALLSTGDRDARLSAGERAESRSISSTLDPAVERDELEPEVDRYHAAEKRDDAPGMEEASRKIRKVLERELRHRLDLTARAVAALRADPRPINPGASELAVEATRERLGDYVWRERRVLAASEGERIWIPDPETDRHPSAAAARYLKHTAAAETLHHALVHHDDELQAETVARGDGLSGRIVRVEDRSQSPRATLPYWTIESSAAAPLRLRVGSKICVAGLPQRTGKIRALEVLPGGTRRALVEITNWKTKPRDPIFVDVPHAADSALEGEDVTLIAGHIAFLSFAKRKKVWERSGPGAWLTHGMGAAPAAAGRVERDPLAAVDALRAR